MDKKLKNILFISSAVYFSIGLFLPVYYQILLSRGIAQFGLLLGLVSMGSIVSAYATGWFSDAKNPLNVLAILLICEAIAISLYAGDWNVWVFYILQFVYGSLSIGMITALQSLVSKNSSGKEGKGMGSFNAISQSVMGIGMILGGFLVSVIGILLVVSIVAIILFGIAFWLLNKKLGKW